MLFRFSMGFIDSMVAKCELTSDPRVGSGINVRILRQIWRQWWGITR